MSIEATARAVNVRRRRVAGWRTVSAADSGGGASARVVVGSPSAGSVTPP